MEGFSELNGFLNKISPLSKKEESEIKRLFTLKTYEKNEFFLKQGAMPVYAAFVVRGAFREFYTDRNGREFNKAFCFRGDFTGSYYSLNLNKPAIDSIQAMSPSSVLIVRYADVKKHITSSVPWLRISISITHRLLMKKLEREFQLLTLSADERYSLLQKQFPELEQLLPAYHIASFLGITPISLSRIRNGRKK
jgi:CRP-like cAMP-binding protein